MARSKNPPAATLESRENVLMSLAVDLAEKKLRDGTASPMIISHFLKMATTREQLEKQKMEQEIRLMGAKSDAIDSGKELRDVYNRAMNAMKLYAGEDAGCEQEKSS